MKGTKGDRLWNTTANKITISQDVVFNEDFFSGDCYISRKKYSMEHDVSNDVQLDDRMVDDEHAWIQNFSFTS